MMTTDQANELPNDLPDDPDFLKELIDRQRELIAIYVAYRLLVIEEISELRRKLENIENTRSNN